MCKLCDKSGMNFEIEHTEQACPLYASFYCPNCAQYGHLDDTCPAKPKRWARDICYLEQLIPPSDLVEYKITSKTKYTPNHDIKDVQRLLEIYDSDKVINAFLINKSIKLSKKQKENRLKLEEYARCNNMRLVFMSEATDSV